MGRGKIRGDATVHVAVVMHERAVVARFAEFARRFITAHARSDPHMDRD